MSNNSVVCNDIKLLPDEFWRTYDGKSEPYGLINLKLAQSCGRLGETQYKDKDVRGFNPCAEQSLANFETCCLAEVYLSNIESYDELIDVLRLLYRVNKHSLRLPCHHKETEEIVHKNMRMGIGVTGYLQATEEQRGWLSKAYEELRDYDKEYSAQHGWPISIKLSTCKPSGTLSLLPGVTPGVHPGYAQYMIRRIRIAADNPLVQQCRDHGYPVEYVRGFDGKDDYSTVVVEFPFSYPEGTVLAKEVTAIEQLKWVERMQREWSDNSVSCTVYYRSEELPEIKKYLGEKYNKTFKTVSFLLHSDHGFDQAPFEEITKEEYDRRVAASRLITGGEVDLEIDLSECAGGACPIR
jgi:ribonucleotide reductase alpha subunit